MYAKIWPTPYNVPMDPVGTATVPTQATMVLCPYLRYGHVESHRINDNHHHMDAELKTMVL